MSRLRGLPRQASLAVALCLCACVTAKKPKSTAKKAPAAAAELAGDEAAPADLDARIDKIGSSLVIQATSENLKSVAAEGRMQSQVPGNVPAGWTDFAKGFAADIAALEEAVRSVESAKTDAEGAERLTAAAAPVARVETASRLLASHRDGDPVGVVVYFIAALKAGSSAAGSFFEANAVTGDGLDAKVRRGFIPVLRALADRDDATAQYVLATEYLVGKLTAKNEKKAASYAAKSAKQGNEGGQLLLDAISRRRPPHPPPSPAG